MKSLPVPARPPGEARQLSMLLDTPALRGLNREERGSRRTPSRPRRRREREERLPLSAPALGGVARECRMRRGAP